MITIEVIRIRKSFRGIEVRVEIICLFISSSRPISIVLVSNTPN
jgi:hypothetical protein